MTTRFGFPAWCVFDTSQQPVVVVWEVTRACGLACDHCRAAATPGHHPRELDTAAGKRLLESASRFGDGQIVVLSGGDPFARDDLRELIAHGDDCGLRMAVTPAATQAVTRDRLAGLADAGLRRIALSLDAADRAAHDARRGHPGTFRRTLRIARWACELDLGVQINTTVTAGTADGLPDLRTTVASLDPVRWALFFLVPIGRGEARQSVSPERADAICEWLHRVNEESAFAVKTTEAPQHRRVGLQRQGTTGADLDPTTGPPSARPSVRAGDGFVFVSHTGEVTPSGFLPRPVGTVRERALPELYREAPLFDRLRDTDALNGRCGRCPYRVVCGGSRSRAFAVHGDPLGSDPLCPYDPGEG